MADTHSAELIALYDAAYAAYPEWLARMRSMVDAPIASETVMVCNRLPEMASAIFVAGYVTALVDTMPRAAGSASE